MGEAELLLPYDVKILVKKGVDDCRQLLNRCAHASRRQRGKERVKSVWSLVEVRWLCFGFR